MLKRFSKILSLLLVFAMIVPGIAQAANLENAEGINRIKGENRWETAVAVSEKVAKGDTVILANGQNYPDALAGSALAKALNAPILLTKANELPVETAKQLEKLAPKTVILLGGETVIGEEVVEELKGYEIERIAGSNRAETAAKVAEKVVAKSGSKTAVLAYGNGFADALSVGPVAGAKGWPILFTSKAGQLTNTTKDALVKLGIEEVVIVGGTSVISDEVKNELANDYSVRRIAGANRYETSLEIAKEFGNVEAIMLANAQKYADALVGAPLAAALNAPIILVKDKSEALNEDQAKLVKESFEKEFYILGGEAVVSKEVEAQTIKLVEEAAEEAKELKVVSISAINNNSVVVKITAPAEDLLGATIEVLDNEDNAVAVKPVDIAEGDLEVQFTFEKEVEKFEGVWTVEGIEIDFDLLDNLITFRDTNDQLEFNKTLEDLGIENVKTENIPEYLIRKVAFVDKLEGDEFYGVEEDLTVEAIQNWIDEVNADLLTEEESAEIAETVTDALADENDVELLAALQNPAFARVNPEWLGAYKNTLAGTETSVEAIQGVIDGVNNTNVGSQIASIVNNVNKTELNKIKAVVEAYATPTDKGEQTDTTKKALNDIAIQIAVADVDAATTPNILKSRMTALDALLKDADKIMPEVKAADGTVTYAGYVDANAKDYITELNGVQNMEAVRTAIDTVNKAVEQAEEDAQVDINNRIKTINAEVINEDDNRFDYIGYSFVVYYDVQKDYKGKVEELVIELYNDDELLATNKSTSKVLEAMNKKEIIKDADHSGYVISSPFDVFDDFDYKNDGWWINSGWDGDVFDAPTEVKVKIKYTDGTIAEKTKKDLNLDNSDSITNKVVETITESEDVAEVEGLLVDLANADKLGNFLNIKVVDRALLAETIVAEEDDIENLDEYIGEKADEWNNALEAVNALENDSEDGAITNALIKITVFKELKPVEKVNVKAAFVAEVLDKLEGGETPNFKSYTELSNFIKGLK